MSDSSPNLDGKRVTLMGLGRHGGGLGAATWLVSQGARVTISDAAPASALRESLAAISTLPIERIACGGHEAGHFHDAEMVVVNPAVRPGNVHVQQAAALGAVILTEVELFLNHCPGRVVAVTGSNGKSTTATMIAEILTAEGHCTWLGGNLGGSLLDQLPQIRPQDFVVLELSSFQLHYLSPVARKVDVAVVTGCTPNHLDWHGDFQEYQQAKRRLLTQLATDGTAVLNPACPVVSSWRDVANGRIAKQPAIQSLPELQVPGLHNQQNAVMAAAAAQAASCTDRAIQEGLTAVQGLPHRLEKVAEIGGRLFINDSKATTPEATIAALETFDRPIWLLAGGVDKGGDLQLLAKTVTNRTRGAALFGAAGSELSRRVTTADGPALTRTCNTLEESLSWCWHNSTPGDVILLSPAMASFDQFRDYCHRGERFRQAVSALTPNAQSPQLPATVGS